MKILQLTAHFSPNLGGVETHLDDLVSGLLAKKHRVFVLAYRPLSVKASWQIWQTGNNLQILRLPWFPGLFNKLAKFPIGEFLYLTPGLFISLPLVLLFFRPSVIHAHGLISGFIGTFWGKLFGIRVVISTHSIYNFPSAGLYRHFAKIIFQSANKNICLSGQSVTELLHLGIPSSQVRKFTYWVDLKKFRPQNKQNAKKRLKWTRKFTVLFVGRLVAEKGVPELLSAAKLLKKSTSLKIAGSGPMESEVAPYYIGRISQADLPLYYCGADLVIVPSTHEEGFGRVIIESLACGTPVIASNRGAIPEAMNNTVGKLIRVSSTNLAKAINYYATHKKQLQHITNNARSFAAKRYSTDNLQLITSTYCG